MSALSLSKLLNFSVMYVDDRGGPSRVELIGRGAFPTVVPSLANAHLSAAVPASGASYGAVQGYRGAPLATFAYSGAPPPPGAAYAPNPGCYPALAPMFFRPFPHETGSYGCAAPPLDFMYYSDAAEQQRALSTVLMSSQMEVVSQLAPQQCAASSLHSFFSLPDNNRSAQHRAAPRLLPNGRTRQRFVGGHSDDVDGAPPAATDFVPRTHWQQQQRIAAAPAQRCLAPEPASARAHPTSRTSRSPPAPAPGPSVMPPSFPRIDPAAARGSAEAREAARRGERAAHAAGREWGSDACNAADLAETAAAERALLALCAARPTRDASSPRRCRGGGSSRFSPGAAFTTGHGARESARASSRTRSGRGMTKTSGRAITSLYRGVCWNSQQLRWHAQIQANLMKHNLGFFTSELDAARAYDVASRKLNRPDRQKLNFPRGGDLGSGARARPGATDSDYAARRDAPHR